MQEIYPLPPTTTLFSQIVRWKLVLDMVVTVFDYQCSRIMDPWSQNKVHKDMWAYYAALKLTEIIQPSLRVWPRHSFAAKSLITDFDDVESEINRLLTPRYLPSAGISSSDCSDKSSH
ncbi:uncharacterized protein [Porites lutea]|uniref:uncharacterized protein n=1 Tax=Porites lutea TaxID=51062 RepID=UPI003CC64E50